MPRAAELEEFGLEVESEHHALISEQPTGQRKPMELTSPTKSQVQLLQSTNTKRVRPGMLKWALLVLVLAVIAFLNVGQEQVETDLLEGEESLEELEAKALEEHRGDWTEDKGEYRVFGDESKKENTKKGDVKPEKSGGQAKVDQKPKSDEKQIAKGNVEDIESDEDDAIGENDTTEEEEEKDADKPVNIEHPAGFQPPNKANVPPHKGYSKEDADAAKAKAEAEAKESDEHENSMAELKQAKEQPMATEKNTESSSNKAAGGPFTLERVKATREAAQGLISMLEDYYYGAETTAKMLIKSWVGSWEFDENIDEMDEMIQKLVDTMIRALVTEDQTDFIIGTIGSSVAAGHDNCNYDSYENQLQRTLSPVWEAAGMNLVCQNAGEGGGCGDTFANQVFCIKQNVSPKIDIAHYSWSYFEVGDYNGALVSRENLIRWTQMMPKQPPVHVINVEGSVEAGADEKKLQQYYAKYGYNAFYMRFAYRQGGYDYEAEAKNGIDRFGWAFVGDGYHNTTRYGELKENEGRRESLGVVLRNWHPGPLGFQLVADAFSIVYSKAILLALDIIEEIIAEGHDPSDVWGASKRKMISKKSLPRPLHCDPEYCTVDEAPGCINYELPTYGTWGARVEDPDNDLNPHKGELQKWEVWHEPRDFWHLVPKDEIIYWQDREDKEICKHLDLCGGISATSSENGMVVFRLPKMEVGLVAICGCCGATDIAIEMFINNTNIEIRYNGALLDRGDWDLFPNPKCARLLKRFPTEGPAAQTPTGHAYLSIKALDLEQPVRISHVITL